MALPFPVIVGVPRSGTTMLRFMLDSHPDLAIPPETGFLSSAEIVGATDRHDCARLLTAFPPDAPAWVDFGIDKEVFQESVNELPESAGTPDVLRAFYALYAARQQKTRGGDKTPSYLQHMATVASVLPEARFIHIVRDGRDVALSWRETWFAPSRHLPDLVGKWASDIRAARAVAPTVPYLEVTYEGLVREPETVLRSICAFIEIDFRQQMLASHLRAPERLAEHQERVALDGRVVVSKSVRHRQQWRTTLPPQPSRIGVWRTEMSPEEQTLCDAAACGLLAEF